MNLRISSRHFEQHRADRIGWLRAAVLGANDGIISTASLILGVASAHGGHKEIIVAGLAGLVAGAASMAAGEYVSVSSQADTEKADLAKETQELKDDPEGELAELAGIYKKRGLDLMLAKQVATQLMAHNALEAHARDELGITATVTARPVQAAFASATTFAVGAALPLLAAVLASPSNVITATAGSSLFFLSILGAVAAGTGGAVLWKGALRVTFWGALAMGLTTLVGHLFGTSVG